MWWVWVSEWGEWGGKNELDRRVTQSRPTIQNGLDGVVRHGSVRGLGHDQSVGGVAVSRVNLLSMADAVRRLIRYLHTARGEIGRVVSRGRFPGTLARHWSSNTKLQNRGNSSVLQP